MGRWGGAEEKRSRGGERAEAGKNVFEDEVGED